MPGGYSVSFDDILGSNPEEITLDRLENFFNQIIRSSSQKSNLSQFVRVVEADRIYWMTAEEADTFLRHSAQQTHPDPIQQVLRSDYHILGKEIKVFLLLISDAVKQYRADRSIPEVELNRIEPIIIRYGRQIRYQLKQCHQIQERINETRNRNPILNEFEQKMGDLLANQKKGNHEAAASIAHELAGMKHRYVRLSQLLKSDLNDAKKLRIEIHRLKKNIISTHRYLAAQREGVLESEIQNLQENVASLTVLLQRSEKQQKNGFVLALQEKSQQLDRKERERKAIQKEQQILKMKEEEIDLLLSGLDNKLKPALAPSSDETVDLSSPSSKDSQPEEEKKNYQRMVALERRQHLFKKL